MRPEGQRPDLVLAALGLAALPLAVLAHKGLVPLAAGAGLAALLPLWRGGRLAAAWQSPWAALFAAAVAWALLSAAWALVPGNALGTAGKLAALLLAGLLLLALARDLNPRLRRRAAVALVAGFALGMAILAWEVLFDYPLKRAIALRLSGRETVGGGVIDNAVAVALLLAVPAALALRRLDVPAGLAWLALLPPALISMLVNSQSARLAAVSGLVAMALAIAGGGRLVRLLGAAAAGLVLALPVLPLGPLAPARWEAALAGVKYSAIHRLHIWEFVAQRIAERPLLGWGMDASRSLPGGDRELPGGGVVLSLHPHNGALQLWVELGLPGALLGAAAVWLAFAAAARLPLAFERALATGLAVAALVIASLSFGIWQSWWLAALLLAAVLTAAFSVPAQDA